MAKKNVFDQLDIAANDLYKNINIFLSGKKGRTVDFSSDTFIIDCTEGITRKDSRSEYHAKALNTHLVTNKKLLDSDILELFVVDLDGKVISSTNINKIGQDVSDNAFFPETMEQGSSITGLHYFPDSELSQYAFFDVTCFLLSKEDQAPIGMIVNRYTSDCIWRAIHRGQTEENGQVKKMMGLGETGETYIVNSDKRMITESRFIKNAMYNQLVDTVGVRFVFNNKIGMTGIYSDYRDIQVLGVSKYLEEVNCVIVASKNTSEAFAPVIFLRNIVTIIGSSGIVVIVLVAVFASTKITGSIEKTTEASRRIAKHDLENPIMNYKSVEDLKKLGEQINLEMNKHRKVSIYNIRSINNDEQSLFNLKRSSEDWTITFDAMPDIITIHNKNSKIVRANKAFYEAFNIDEKHLYGKKCSEIFHCSSTALHNCSIVKCARSLKSEYEEFEDSITGGILFLITYPLIDEEGLFQGAIRQQKNITEKKKIGEEIKRAKEIPIELSLSFQKTEDKRYSFTGIIRDRTFEVNAKKQLIEKSNKLEEYSQALEQKVELRTLKLREANEKLQEADRAKTEFLSVVSHELLTRPY